MSRAVNRLSNRDVARLKTAGLYADGNRLYARVLSANQKSYCYVWRVGAKRYEFTIGAVGEPWTIETARIEAGRLAAAIADGRNPIEERREQRKAANAKAGRPKKLRTFGEVAEVVIDQKARESRNAKHRAQWRRSLEVDAASLWNLQIETIDTPHVLNVLDPIWRSKPETASRLRGRIEHVLDAGRALKLRAGENPARWRGHLDKILPRRAKGSRGHFGAMAFDDVPKFWSELEQTDGIGALALQFLIATVGRTGEVIGAVWSEIDFDRKIWVIPEERTKQNSEHVVPLSAAAMAALEKAEVVRGQGPWVFPGRRSGSPLSNMAMLMLLQRLKGRDSTPHGMRSAFRDWAGDTQNFPREHVERCLGHRVEGQVEAAYRRGNALEKRREIMEAWAEFLNSGES